MRQAVTESQRQEGEGGTEQRWSTWFSLHPCVRRGATGASWPQGAAPGPASAYATGHLNYVPRKKTLSNSDMGFRGLV